MFNQDTQISITSWSMTSADGDAFRMSMKARITSSSASEAASRLPIALSNSKMMGACLSSIVKNIKRVMAAEYSRELGGKGARRSLPDSEPRLSRRRHRSRSGSAGRWSMKGNGRKACWRRANARPCKPTVCGFGSGSDEEIAVVRWIFQQFVLERKTDVEIARQLNQGNIPNHHGRPWTYLMVQTF